MEDEGATALAHAITHNTTLVKLEIQRNGFRFTYVCKIKPA
jgi:hypothetical protein